MEYLIGVTGESDPNRIPLVTCAGWSIPNSRRPLPRDPESQRAAAKMHTTAHESIWVRSLSADYNCVGLVFASRRTVIDVDHVSRILREDGYVAVDLPNVVQGDIVTYQDKRGTFAHVGVVFECTRDLVNASFRFRILSQWGFDGEYLHDVDDVPSEWLEGPRQYWSERTL